MPCKTYMSLNRLLVIIGMEVAVMKYLEYLRLGRSWCAKYQLYTLINFLQCKVVSCNSVDFTVAMEKAR